MNPRKDGTTCQTVIQTDHKGNRWREVVIIILAILLLLSLSLIVINKYFIIQGISGEQRLVIPEANGMVMDGMLPTNNPDDILEMLQKKVDENQFAFKINANPVFAPDCSTGNLRIENPARNIYGMQVELKLDETGETLYSSPYIAPNQYVESVGLTRQLPAGNHEATAYFTAIHPETNAYMGEVAAEIKLTISNQ